MTYHSSVLLNRYEIEKYIHATAARADLKVVWHKDPNKPPATNGKEIFLKELDETATEQEANQLISSTIHEVEHCKHTVFSALKNEPMANPENSVVGMLMNILEDDNIDYKNAQEFIGDRQIRSQTTADALFNIKDAVHNMQGQAAAKGMDIPKDTKVVIAMTTWQSGNTTDYYRDCVGIQSLLEPMLDPQQQGWYSKLKSGDYYDALKNLREMQDDKARTVGVFDLSKRIAKEVFEMDLEEEQKKAEDKQKENQKSKGKGDEGEGEGKSKAKASAGKDDSDKEGEEGDSISNVTDYKVFAVDQHDRSKHPPNADQHINYRRDSYDETYSPSPLASTEVVDYVLKSSNTPGKSPTLSGSGRRFDASRINTETGGFNNAVRRLLQIRSRGRWEYGTKKGSLHNANLYRLTLQGASGYNERVFKKHVDSDTLDTCLAILVDISGSMSGTKIQHAASAAAHISDTIGNTLHIPTEIVGFTENSCNNAMFIYRSFDCKRVQSSDLIERIGASCKHMEQNADGDSILWEHSRIVRRKEKRKILIVLSDGSPASSKAGDCYSYTKSIVKQIEEKSPVDILAVGIRDENVKKIYKEHYVIHDSADIEKALLTIIKRKVI